MAVYLDTSVFDHLYKKIGCTAADIANLRKQIYGRELSILLSIHTLEEILLDRKARPELLVARIKLTLSLGNFRRMVKPCDQLLIDDIRAYAEGGAAARPFIDTKLQNVMSEGIAALVESDGEELDEDMVAALETARSQRGWFRDRPKTNGDARENTTSISFDYYCRRELPHLLEAQAQCAGVLESCRARGIDGLLNLPSLRAATHLALVAGYDRASSSTESILADFCHVPCAAAVAETLVSDSPQLHQVLARASLANLELLDLAGLMKKVA